MRGKTSKRKAAEQNREAEAFTVPDDGGPEDYSPAPKNKGGRPRKPMSPEDLERLAALQCTDEEIAAFFRVSVDTVERRRASDPAFLAAIERGRAHGLLSLRRKQFRTAVEDGNVAMLIWLGKQYLGQADKRAVDLTFEDPSKATDEELLKKAKEAIALVSTSAAAKAVRP